MPDHPPPIGTLVPALLDACEQAALAAAGWTGCGDGLAADAAAVAAMRRSLQQAPCTGRVVIGEGEKDAAPMLAPGEPVGCGGSLVLDIAVDPLEGTRACAAGAAGAIAVLAAAPAGSLLATPGWYMDKRVVGPSAAGRVDLDQPVEQLVAEVAQVRSVPLTDLRVVVLDKPRHRDLSARLQDLGVRLRLIPDGDVMAALQVLLPDGDADLLLGVGGAPEGVLTACAVRLLGGDMLARLAPRSDGELAALRAAGQRPGAMLRLDDLVRTDDCLVAATAVTDAPPLTGVADRVDGRGTCSLVLAPGQPPSLVTTLHRSVSLAGSRVVSDA